MKFSTLAKYTLIIVVGVIVLHTVYNAYVSSQTITNAGQ